MRHFPLAERISMAVDFDLFVNLSLTSAGSITYGDYLNMDPAEAEQLLKTFNKVIKKAKARAKEEAELHARGEFYKNAGR